MASSDASEFFDVVIVGAGISGIGAACHLGAKCPDRSYVILESREALGGTWDLFRYPGIRSDSDMYTLGFEFKPWREGKAIADGPAIRRYLEETVDEHSVREHIRFRQRLVSASWDSGDATWRVDARQLETGETVTVRCRFLMMCSGYYRYDKGYTPEFAGRDDFRGRIVHPQAWPEDLDVDGKRIVVIGSGATAVTLVPELARTAERVTMLQRSPTYMVSMPDTDWIANLLRKILPAKMAYAATRWKNVGIQQFIYRRTRKSPDKIRKKLLKLVRKELGPDVDVDTHFTPRYDPWDQRLCLVPNSDFFVAVKDGAADVVTDSITRFTEDGVLLESGRELPADIIVTATGLELCVLGDAKFDVDGRPVDFSECFSYKSMMFSDVPNLISTFGYINASWTLKADLTADFACRVLNHMSKTGTTTATPTLGEEAVDMPALPWISGFSSGYIQRRLHLLPKQGDRGPWVNSQNYLLDRKVIGEGPVDDGALRFSRPAAKKVTDHAA